MDAVEQYIKHIAFEKRYSDHTIREYKSDLKSFIEYIESYHTIQDPLAVSLKEIREWIFYLLEKNESIATIHRRLSALKSFYKYHLKCGNTSHNPAKNVILPKKNTPLPSFLDEKQTQQLFETQTIDWTNYKEVRDYMILAMFYMTGMRRAELIGLKIDDIDWANQSIKVLGKRNKQRIIPIPSWFIKQLEQYKKIRCEILKNENQHLFLTEKGKPLYPKLVYLIVRDYLTRITHQTRRSPHTMRHTFATQMLNAGADLNTIKELLGHSSLAATQVYTHNNFEKLKKSYKQAHPRG
ncbi:MAG TPA: tyrosine-type recombinase/integrase [Salinivirgaceae bacterium]|nr:tyrosine-type recombinase/integrase [Salinivirgaceae bacterium]